MVNHLLLWAADNPRLERSISNNKLFGKLVHRFIAGESSTTRWLRPQS